MLQLKITRPNSLLSVELEREIDERQLSIIKLVLASDMTYGEALGVFGAWFDAPKDVPWDHSDEDSVNGTLDYVSPQLAQYQRESR